MSEGPIRVVVTATSVEEAKRHLRTQLAEDQCIISEEILSDGGEKILKGSAPTPDSALQEALSEVHDEWEVISHEQIQSAELTLDIQAFTAEQAKDGAKQKAPQLESIESVDLQTQGRKGFLGIGRTPNTYRVVVRQPAVVQVSVRTVPTVEATVGTVEQKLDLLLKDLRSDDTHNKTYEELIGLAGENPTLAAQIAEALFSVAVVVTKQQVGGWRISVNAAALQAIGRMGKMAAVTVPALALVLSRIPPAELAQTDFYLALLMRNVTAALQAIGTPDALTAISKYGEEKLAAGEYDFRWDTVASSRVLLELRDGTGGST